MHLKLVAHDCKAPHTQQVFVHELLAGLKVAAQADAHHGQVLPHWKEVPALQVARLPDLSDHWQACTCSS